MALTTTVLRRYVSDHGLTYGKYAVVGAVAGVATIAVREVVAAILPVDAPMYYAASVVLAYPTGIVLSYCGHRRLSFGGRRLATGTVRRFSRFAAIAVLGLTATTALSVAIRYGLSTDALLGRHGAGFAFAVATVLASVLTYGLNSRYTFRGPRADRCATTCRLRPG